MIDTYFRFLKLLVAFTTFSMLSLVKISSMALASEDGTLELNQEKIVDFQQLDFSIGLESDLQKNRSQQSAVNDEDGSEQGFFRALAEQVLGASELKTIKKNIPLGNFPYPVSPECLPESVDGAFQLSSTALNNRKFAGIYREYFERCGDELHKNSTPGLAGLVEYSEVQYDVIKNPKIKKIKLTTSQGAVLEGHMAIQELTKPRPWVIVKCGTFCTAQSNEQAVKNAMIFLFDESPFNVVVLGNRTGDDNIKNNFRLHVSGALESQDFYLVRNWLVEDSPYRKLISSVHAIGFSLAGNAAFLADYLEPYFRQKAGSKPSLQSASPLFDSIAAICPVADLEASLQSLVKSSVTGELFTRITWAKVQELKPYLEKAAEVFPPKHRQPSREELPGLLARFTMFFSKSTPSMADGYLTPIRSEAEFWKNNNYLDLARTLNLPLFVWASRDDSIVANDLNAVKAMHSSFLENNDKFAGLNLSYGDHCGFATAYGYPVETSMLRRYILLHDPQFALQLHRRKQLLFADMKTLSKDQISFNQRQTILKTQWDIAKGGKFVTLRIEFFDSRLSPWCGLANIGNIYESPQSCRRVQEVRVDLHDLPILDGFGDLILDSETSVQIANRKFNSYLKLTRGHGNSIVGTNFEGPLFLEWDSLE